jgi:hypothetical protein
MRCLTLDTNIRSLATAQYKNFNFSAMENFGENKLGINDNGLFVLSGDLDEAAEISAWFKTGMTDLGIQANKRLRKIYLGLETDGELEIDITADDVVVKTYAIPASKVNQQRIKVAAGRNQKGVYWAFTIRNKKGVKFSIDSIQILPVILHHGRL